MLFFYTMSIFDPISVDPSFVEDEVKKLTTLSDSYMVRNMMI